MSDLFSDEYLEHWARVFVSMDLFRRRGIRFEVFVQYPQEIVAAVRATPDAVPLLPRQQWVMQTFATAEQKALTATLHLPPRRCNACPFGSMGRVSMGGAR